MTDNRAVSWVVDDRRIDLAIALGLITFHIMAIEYVGGYWFGGVGWFGHLAQGTMIIAGFLVVFKSVGWSDET